MRRARARTVRVVAAVTGIVDRLVPKRASIFAYSYTDLDDQILAMLPELAAITERPIVWAVSRHSYGARVPASVRVVRLDSLPAAWAYLRSRLVVHTMTLDGLAAHCSRRRRIVNLWHGMPVKRIDLALTPRQAGATHCVATSEVHARNLARAWALPVDRVHVLGLPRNDVLLTDAAVPGAAPTVVWLPTYRTPVFGARRPDGTDFRNPYQLPGVTHAMVRALAAELDCRIIVKSHPLAAAAPEVDDDALAVWSDGSLAERGLTLYDLLSRADVLVTDYSSVWIDFLLTQRPIVFTVADVDAYRTSRGFYFDPRADPPGALCADWPDLAGALRAALSGEDAFAGSRADALGRHHANVDPFARDRVRTLAATLLDGGR